MKIVIDAFNLGFKQGTGIATYARELSTLLYNKGHEVYPIFGINGVGNSSALAFKSLAQTLSNQGEAGRKDLAKWGVYFLKYSINYCLRKPIKANLVPHSEDIHYQNIASKLPAFTELYNIPSIYRSAQALSVLFSKRPTLICLPKTAGKPDIFHITCPLPIAIRGVPKVVTYHDLIPLTLPESTSINLRHYYKMMKLSLQDADMILAVSNNSKKDLINILDIPEEKISVTYQAVNLPMHYRTLGHDEVANYIGKKYALSYKNYFIYYGAIEPKKNVARIIEAFNFAKTDMPLVIVGKDAWLFEDVSKAIALAHETPAGIRQFKRIPYASFETLMYLLKGARGLVFPSLYEGFGLPVLESMQMGCPVITSNTSSLPEVGGDAVHYVDPFDVHSIAEAIDLFSSDDAYINSLVKKGKLQVERFSPELHYQRIEAAYKNLG